MPTLPTAAIIGAGSSGIAAAKALHERGIAFDCFEASDRVGGNWVFGNRNGMSAAYRDLHINTSRDRMEYSDFPMPKSYPDFPHHTQIAAYFDAYVDHFGVPRPHPLRDARRVTPSSARDGSWLLTDGHGEAREYDMLVVANGHHWDKRWPEPAFPGSDDVRGHPDARPRLPRQRVPRRQGRRRARDGQQRDGHRRRVQLRRELDAPRRPPRRLDRAEVPLRQAAGPDLRRCRTSRTGWHARVGELDRPPAHRAPRALRPAASPTTASARRTRRSPGGSSTASSTARSRRGRTSRELGPDWVQFADGTRVHADVVIYCTGYRITFPFFDEDFLDARPTTASSCFAASSRRATRASRSSGCCSRSARSCRSPRRRASGSPSTCAASTTCRRRARWRPTSAASSARMRKRYVASKRHTIQVDFDRYLYDLRRERRRGAARAAAAGLRCRCPRAPRCGAARRTTAAAA